MTIEELQSYELVEKREIAELNSVGYYLKHKKTGAKVCLLSNDDENKVFYIGFRTPAPEDTGVAPYPGAFRIVRFPGVPGKGSLCGVGEGLPEYLPERHDISG